jgi:hypothetical protein
MAAVSRLNMPNPTIALSRLRPSHPVFNDII